MNRALAIRATPLRPADALAQRALTRRALELAIEQAIAALDAMDDDPDREDVSEDEGAQCDDEGYDGDREDGGDDEPALGSQESDRGGTVWTPHHCFAMSNHEEEPDGRTRSDVRAGRLRAGRPVTNRGDEPYVEIRGRYPVRMFPLAERGA